MILGGMFWRLFAAALSGQQCRLHAAQPPSQYTRPSLAVISPVLARQQWAVTLAAFFAEPTVCCAWFALPLATAVGSTVWRALYPAAHLPYSVKMQKVLPHRLYRNGSGAASFSSQDAGLSGMLGRLLVMNQPKLGCNAVWRRLWFTD